MGPMVFKLFQTRKAKTSAESVLLQVLEKNNTFILMKLESIQMFVTTFFKDNFARPLISTFY